MAGRYCSRCGTARGDTSTAPLVVCPGCGWVEASDRTDAVQQAPADDADSPTVSASHLPPHDAHPTVSLHKPPDAPPAAPYEQNYRPAQPPPYGAPYGFPPRATGGRGRWLAAGAAVVVLGAAIGIILAVGSNSSTPDAGGSSSASPTPTAAGSDTGAGKARDTEAAASTTTVVSTMPTPSPTVPITVTSIDLAAVADHPRVAAVAQLLDTYFTGINDHDAARAASVFAPDGAINPDSPRAVAAFSRAIRTTTDDLIVVRAISGTTNLRVKTSFRSRQAASLGPDGQTCTRWNLTYVIRGSSSGDLELLRSVDVSSRGC